MYDVIMSVWINSLASSSQATSAVGWLARLSMDMDAQAFGPSIGVRVVRGPAWSWGDQDGGEGYVGTVLEVAPNPRYAPAV